MMGGCSVPISALATIDGNQINFKGAVHSFDGQRCFISEKTFPYQEWQQAGQVVAGELLSQNGAKELLEEIKNKKWDAEGTIY
jgi:hydroxymethylbilane synthase